MRQIQDPIYFSDTISSDDCRAIAQAINEENKIHPHMIPVCENDLFRATQEHGGLVLRLAREGGEDDLVGFVKITVLDEVNRIFEWGSLMVFPEHRGKGYGEFLIHAIVEKFQHLSLLSVTTEIQVVKANQRHRGHQVEITDTMCPTLKEETSAKFIFFGNLDLCFCFNAGFLRSSQGRKPNIAEIPEVIEGPQALLDDDRVFVNRALQNRIHQGEFQRSNDTRL